MDDRLLWLGFSSVEAFDRRILQLRRYIADETERQPNFAPSSLAGERIGAASLSPLREAFSKASQLAQRACHRGRCLFCIEATGRPGRKIGCRAIPGAGLEP